MTANLVIPGQLPFVSWSINLDEVLLEQLDHYMAVENFLTDDDEPPPDATNLENVRRYLKAFHHLCDVEDWQRASEILSFRLDKFADKELGIQLGVWGYHHQQIELYSKLYGKLGNWVDAICLSRLGTAYRLIDNYVSAHTSYVKALKLFLKLGDKEHSAWALHELGLIEADYGRDSKASAYYTRAISLFRELENPEGIATFLILLINQLLKL